MLHSNELVATKQALEVLEHTVDNLRHLLGVRPSRALDTDVNSTRPYVCPDSLSLFSHNELRSLWELDASESQVVKTTFTSLS